MKYIILIRDFARKGHFVELLYHSLLFLVFPMEPPQRKVYVKVVIEESNTDPVLLVNSYPGMLLPPFGNLSHTLSFITTILNNIVI